MNPNHVYIVILAGGEGTRFAPLSTPRKPKQFLCITHQDHSMLQQTYNRIQGLCANDHIYVSTNEKYVSLVHHQLPQVSFQNIIGEPFKKNTAPSIALMCHFLFKKDPQATILFVPADHFVANPKEAMDIFKKALELVFIEPVLVVFGVSPRFPSVDYGYIQLGQSSCNQQDVLTVESFVEKPNELTAKQYLKSGQYLWNSGLFAWKAEVLLENLHDCLPKMGEQLKIVQFDNLEKPTSESLEAFFEQAQSISIDYAVMEKAKNVKAFLFNVGWSDVGTWEGLKNLQKEFNLDLPKEVRNIARCDKQRL